jgi:hypothetical protein
MVSRSTSDRPPSIQENVMMKVYEVIKCVGGGASLLMAGLAVSACATNGAPTDAASDPIAEVDLANGSRVMFFEPAPGALAIGQQAASGVAPVETAGKSPLEIYRSIAPGQPVPSALAEAQVRADQARSARPARALPQPAAVAGPEDFSASWFASTVCSNTNYSFLNCHTGPNNTGVTGDLAGTHDDIDEFQTTLCVNSGKVTLRAWVEGDQTLGVQVLGGNCLTYHWWSGLFNADSIGVSSTIDSASGNYFLAVMWNH